MADKIIYGANRKRITPDLNLLALVTFRPASNLKTLMFLQLSYSLKTAFNTVEQLTNRVPI